MSNSILSPAYQEWLIWQENIEENKKKNEVKPLKHNKNYKGGKKK